MIGCLGIALIVVLLIKPTTWMFLLCGGIFVSCIAYEQFQHDTPPSHTPLSTQVGFWFFTLFSFVVVSYYLFISPDSFELVRRMPTFWRLLVPMVVLTALAAQSWPLRHHVHLDWIKSQFEHVEATTMLDRAHTASSLGLTSTEATPIIVAKANHRAALDMRLAELPVKKEERRQDIELNHLEAKLNDRREYDRQRKLLKLEITKAKALSKLDIKKERDQIRTVVEGTLRLRLAPEHTILDLRDKILEQLEDLEGTTGEAHAIHLNSLNFLKERLNELCQRNVQSSQRSEP